MRVSINGTFLERENYRDRKQIRGFQGLECGEDAEYKETQEHVWGDGNFLYFDVVRVT